MNYFQKRKSENQLKKILKDNCEIVKVDSFNFDKSQFQKLDMSWVSEAFGIAPSVVLGISNAVSTNRISSVLENGVFKVKFKDGINGITRLCKNSEGNWVTAYKDANGKFNQAGLVNVSDEVANPLKAMNAATIVVMVMQVVSIVVGEYYKFEINNNLFKMNFELKNITNFMYNLQLSEIISSFDYLQKISSNYKSGALNEEQIIAALVNVHRIKQISMQNLQLFKVQVNDIVNKFDYDDTDSDIYIEKVENFNLYLSMFKASLKLYAYSNIVEIMLSENYNSSYLKSCIEDINSIVNEYKDNWDDVNRKAYRYFKSSSKSLNPKLIEKIKLFFSGDLKDKYNEISDYTNQVCDFYSNNFNIATVEKEMNVFVDCIEKFDEINNKQLELYYCDGDLYIKKDLLSMEE